MKCAKNICYENHLILVFNILYFNINTIWLLLKIIRVSRIDLL